jgi:hypothetical protein
LPRHEKRFRGITLQAFPLQATYSTTLFLVSSNQVEGSMNKMQPKGKISKAKNSKKKAVVKKEEVKIVETTFKDYDHDLKSIVEKMEIQKEAIKAEQKKLKEFSKKLISLIKTPSNQIKIKF